MHSEIPWITNLVCETHITWSMSASENCKNLLVMMELASAKPKREWSVNRVWSPIVRAWRSASWHKVEKALKRSQNNERQIHVHVSYLQKRFLPKKKSKRQTGVKSFHPKNPYYCIPVHVGSTCQWQVLRAKFQSAISQREALTLNVRDLKLMIIN